MMRSASVMSSDTSGCCARNAAQSGARCRLPKLKGALILSRPLTWLAPALAAGCGLVAAASLERERALPGRRHEVRGVEQPARLALAKLRDQRLDFL